MSSCILVINVGSSSVKFGIFDRENLTLCARGVIEKIGQADSQVKLTIGDSTVEEAIDAKDHKSAIQAILNKTQSRDWGSDIGQIEAVGHRIVHGGERYREATHLNQQVLASLQEISPLAPLHNPVNLSGVKVCQELMPDIPQFAVFDTAFHHTLPEYAYRYALPEIAYSKHKVRRYGFHGISHHYVLNMAADYIQKPVSETHVISLHLGAGASITAVKHGQSIDTTMGFTPLSGIMMATRCGDIDPSIPFYLSEQLKKDKQAIDELLNKDSGIKGISGMTDMQDLLAEKAEGNASAQLAFDMFCYQIKKVIGSYIAIIGNVDALIFTGGIGENSAEVRLGICDGLQHLNIAIDKERNETSLNGIRAIQQANNAPKLLVIATNEEWQIAQQVRDLL